MQESPEHSLMEDHNSKLRHSLKDPDKFTLTFELVPGRGRSEERRVGKEW